MIISLIGYRGCGKSSVAPLLAVRLRCDHVDSDDVIVQRTGKSIGEIFANEGEVGFRRLETEVLAELLQRDPVIVAAGGGAILAALNRERMQAAGPVVWLQAPAETLAGRIAEDPSSGQQRPSLTGRSAVEEVANVLETRRSLYQQAATISVDTEGLSPQQVADHVLAAIETQSPRNRPS